MGTSFVLGLIIVFAVIGGVFSWLAAGGPDKSVIGAAVVVLLAIIVSRVCPEKLR